MYKRQAAGTNESILLTSLNYSQFLINDVAMIEIYKLEKSKPKKYIIRDLTI